MCDIKLIPARIDRSCNNGGFRSVSEASVNHIDNPWGGVYPRPLLQGCRWKWRQHRDRAEQEKAMKRYLIVASRGRNPEKPTDRTAGLPTEQRLEVQWRGYTNTLTSVQKDNLVLEVTNVTSEH